MTPISTTPNLNTSPLEVGSNPVSTPPFPGLSANFSTHFYRRIPVKENVKKKKGEALTKLKEKLGIGKRETEPEPKSMTKPGEYYSIP